MTLALERVGIERGAETSIGPWAEHVPRGESDPSGGAGVAGFHPSARYQRQVRTLGFSAGSAQGFGDNRRISRGTAPLFTPEDGAFHLESYNCAVVSLYQVPMAMLPTEDALGGLVAHTLFLEWIVCHGFHARERRPRGGLRSRSQ